MGFVFASCEPGFESALKADVARRQPELRAAYSRPGLVTFKREAAPDDEVLRPSVWARVWGRSLGRGAHPEQVAALIGARATRLHVFARDATAPNAAELVRQMRAGLAARGPFGSDERARSGERVADVIVMPDEETFVGMHRHEALRSPYAGGAFPLELPDDAPSRAYAKLEQALQWAQLPMRSGQIAVELGSAPGGAAYALVRRGLQVWGVDPGAMDVRVLEFEGPGGARVHHVTETLASVRWEALPREVDWLLCDVHLAPPVALHGLARLVPAWRRSLKGAVITLKMNDARIRASLDQWVERVRALGFSRVEVTHLPANRHELCAVAWR